MYVRLDFIRVKLRCSPRSTVHGPQKEVHSKMVVTSLKRNAFYSGPVDRGPVLQWTVDRGPWTGLAVDRGLRTVD